MSISDFNLKEIDNIEFGVCLDDEKSEKRFFVPADKNVLSVLEKMLMATLAQIFPAGKSAPVAYELSEKYSSTERLKASLTSYWAIKLKEIYQAEGLESSTSALSDPGIMIYYSATFRDKAGKKIVAIKRASKFKATVGKSLVQLINDEIRLIEKDVFRLDTDFDFILTEKEALILKPSAVEYVGNIDAHVGEKIKAKAIELGTRIDFVDFSGLANFVVTKKRSARLIAAIHTHNDLEKIDKDRFITHAQKMGIELQHGKDGKISPKSGHEQKFLEMLDRRLYSCDFVIDEEQRYWAGNRKKLKSV